MTPRFPELIILAMAEKSPHELWYRLEFEELLASFRHNPTSMSIKVNSSTRVLYSTADGIPSHARLVTIHLGIGQGTSQTRFEDLFTLYHAALEKDPENKLTSELKNQVLGGLKDIKRRYNKLVESAEILESQIKFGACGESHPHP